MSSASTWLRPSAPSCCASMEVADPGPGPQPADAAHATWPSGAPQSRLQAPRHHIAVCCSRHRNRTGQRQVLWTPSRQASFSMRSKPLFRTIWAFISSWTITQPTRRRYPQLVGQEAALARSSNANQSSWLNQVERFFALITERKIRRGIYRSVATLRTEITSFIEHHNADPGPFRWAKSADHILSSIQRFCVFLRPKSKMPRTFGSGP